MKRFLTVAVLLHFLFFCGCGALKTVCENQEEAQLVRDRAKAVVQTVQALLPPLVEELGAAQDPEIVAGLALGLSAAQGVITYAYKLTYEVVCPSLQDLQVLELEAEKTKTAVEKNLSKARKAKRGVSS